MSDVKPVVNKRRKIFNWMQVIIIVYCLAGIAAYTWQEKFLFHPVALNADDVFNFPQPYREVNIPVDNSTKYNIVQFTVSGNNIRDVVLYFHGNKEIIIN